MARTSAKIPSPGIYRFSVDMITPDKLHYGQFEIPGSWMWAEVSDIAISVSDGDHQPPPQAQSGVPFLVISDVVNRHISFEKARYVPEEYYNSLTRTRTAKQGDVLFTVTGSYGVPIFVETEAAFCFQRHIALVI